MKLFFKKKKHSNQRILKKYISWFPQKYEAELLTKAIYCEYIVTTN